MSIQMAPVGDTGVLAVFEQKIPGDRRAGGGAGRGCPPQIPGGRDGAGFASLLVRYDPLATDYDAVAAGRRAGRACRRPNPAGRW